MYPPKYKPPATPPKPLTFGKPEKKSLWAKIGPWALIFIGLGAITAMIANNTKQKPLVCSAPVTGSASLTTFGTCTTE